MSEVTLDQALRLALEHHQAGRLAEAEDIYRQVLEVDPRQPDALHLLGVLNGQKGETDSAIALIRQAIEGNPTQAHYHANLAKFLAPKGEKAAALQAYRQALVLNPEFVEAHNDLGNLLRAEGQLVQAAAEYRAALALRPQFAEAHCNLGVVLRELGQLDDAIRCCQEALRLRPNLAEGHNALGAVWAGKGDYAAAIETYRRALEIKPDYAEAWNNLGAALAAHDELDDAVAAYRRALEITPEYAQAWHNLGVTLAAQGTVDELAEAIAAFRQALRLNPGYAEAEHELGNALRDQGQMDAAQAAYQRAITLRPGYAEVHYNLGILFQDQLRLDEASAAYRATLALQPDFAAAWNHLGNALRDAGELEEAIACYRRAVELRPGFVGAHSNLVSTLHFHPGYDAARIRAELARWNQQHAEPRRQFIQPHGNQRDPNRRLRIGYVSPDFRDHCQAFFTVPLLGGHDHENFEIVCYAHVPRADALTARLRGYADRWRDTVGQTDEQLAALVRKDQIDILVDLTMHMGHNRLGLFARKPAPVQVCWLAYPGSTGVTAIDYRLSDPFLDPVPSATAGSAESVYSEETIRLPESFWCYDPLDGREVAVNALPAEAGGVVTFGCLNNFCKINEAVVRLWAKVLLAVPASRLLMLAPEGSPRQRVLELFQQEGIAPQRIEFAPRQPRQQYLELYHRIDVGLDSFPYNGH
ncbi:MAG: tetratricopeptide repeat protein, partial [Phycisphaerae bacterium]